MTMNRLKKKLMPNYSDEETHNLVDEEYVEEDTPRPLAQTQRKPEPEPEDKTPLALLKEIKKLPSPKGTFPIMIGGRPIDLHMIEDYVVRTSPFAMKTIMRYEHAKNIEEIKNYAKGSGIKIKSGLLILIVITVMLLVGGIIMIFFLPDIMAKFASGF